MTWLRAIVGFLLGYWRGRAVQRAKHAAVAERLKNEVYAKVAMAEADAPHDDPELVRRLRDGGAF